MLIMKCKADSICMRKACKRCTVECGNLYAVGSELCRDLKNVKEDTNLKCTLYIPFLKNTADYDSRYKNFALSSNQKNII